MSQFSSGKGKDASGKKFASLNVNQTYKGTKAENRSAAGAPRHGMQSLGKVSQNRRVPAPAYLPSLKKENLGNDPNVNLVPSGSSGWGKKETVVSKAEDQTQTGSQKAQKADQATEISLRPNAGAGFKSQTDQGKGWGNLQSGPGATQPSSSNLFQREFPKLGVDGDGQNTEESVKGKESEEKEPASTNTTNAPPRFGGMPGQVPMQGLGQRPGGPPMNLTVEQQRAMFNGAHMQPPGASQFYPYGPMPYMMMHAFPYYPPNRMPPPGVMGQPPRPAPPATSSESAERPATVKTEDIQDMGDDSDDEGWAGAQEEVDYNVKLKFDESDEEPEPTQTPGSEKTSKEESSTQSKESSDEKSRENAPPDSLGEQTPGFQGQMQFRHPQHWMGGPFPPHPHGFAYPPPWMYPPGYRMPQVSQQRPDGSPALAQGVSSAPPSSTAQVAPSHSVSAADDEKNAERRKRREEDEKTEAQRREAARVKLKQLEDKIRKREEDQRDSESSKSAQRERLDSENSDSSRGGSQRGKSSRDLPPRFMKQQSHPKGAWKEDAAPPSPSPFDSSESGTSKEAIPVPRIMKRNDSLRSDDASSHESWANASLDEEEKSKDAEEIFPVTSKHTAKTLENEAGPKRDSSYERRDKRGEKSANESESRRKQQDVKPTGGNDVKDSEDGQRPSRPPSVSGYDQRSQKSEQGRDAKRSSRGNESRRDGNREYKLSRDFKEHGRGDKLGEWQDQVKDERKNRERQREPKRENETRATKKEPSKGDSDVRSKDVKLVKDLKQETESRDASEVGSEKGKRDSQEAGEKDDRKLGEKVNSKPRTIPDNFKRLEKPKGKSMSLKGSTTVEKEKRSAKSEQKSSSEPKKPSAWSQVVSGETADHSASSNIGKVEEQPKKSIVEIQKEEEIQNEKENLEYFEQIHRKGKDKQTTGNERDGHDPQREPRTTRDRRQDNRRQEERYYDGRYSNRRGNERYDDRYNDKYDYTGKRKTDRDMRRSEDRFDRRRTDGEDRESPADSKYDGSAVDRGYDGRKRGMEDRKRRHDETEMSYVPYEEIYSEEVEAEGRSREQKVEKQKSVDRRPERTKYTERTRGGSRGRQPYGRGRGRGQLTERVAAGPKEGYPFSEIKPDVSRNFSERTVSSEDKEPSKRDVKRPEAESFEDREDRGTTSDSREVRKEKDHREATSAFPQKKSDSSHYDSRQPRDRQNSVEYQDRAIQRQERSDSRRGRTAQRRYESRKEFGNDRRRDRKLENGSSAKQDDAKATDKGKIERDYAKAGEDDVNVDYDEDDEDEEYTDVDDSDVEKVLKEIVHERLDDGEGRDDRGRRPSERGPSKGPSAKSHKSRMRGHRGGFETSLSKSTVPPRFQNSRSSQAEHRRGKVSGIRGLRGRGRVRGTRGQGFGKPPYSRESRPKSSDGKGEEYSGDSDDEYHSAEEALGSNNEELNKPETRHSNDYLKRHSTRGKTSSRVLSSRGRGMRRGGSADHFLGDRQQDRVGHIDASGLTDTLPAAGKALFADHNSAEEKYGHRSIARGSSSTKRLIGDNRGQSIVESHHEFSEPPKKMAKSKSIEKQEFLRQFDVNNIASVVCVDDMPQNDGEGEDGFVEVCNRKKQKARNTEKVRQKEEEKKKLQEDSSVKPNKRNVTDTKETSGKPPRPVKVVDQHTQRATQSFSPVTSQTQLASVSQSQASNAAMAAVGGWEPAQALLRGVQMVSQVESLDGSKPVSGPSQPPINAWKRPLNFAASLSGSPGSGIQAPAPDPKAVGTGKPNASPAKQLPLVSQANQPNEGVLVNGFSDVVNVHDQTKSQDLGLDGSSIEAISVEKTERPSDGENKDRKSSTGRKADQKKINKGTKRETAPRFQSMTKSKGPQNPVLMNGDVINETKKIVTTSIEDTSKPVPSTLKYEDRAPGKRPDGSKLQRCNSESSKEHPDNSLRGFDGTEHPTLTFMHPDTRSEAEKTQSTLKDEIPRREDIIGSLDNTLRKADVQDHMVEEENAKDTARSVIKSLGDENEKNLETRSLPSSTPPLAVEIHPPGPSTGPSSDPGIAKGPVMTGPTSMSQEVSEMSKKVQSLKVLWDTPSLPEEVNTSLTTWSAKDSTVMTSSVVTTANTTESDKRDSVNAKDQIVSTPVAVVAAQGIGSKPEPELNAESTNDASLISKKTAIEQQNNVCKVKPQQKQQQQQQLAEEKKILHSHLFQSPLPMQQTYTLSMQPSSSHNKQPYMMPLERVDSGGVYSRERSTGDITSHHAQSHAQSHVPPHAPVGLQQVRSASPLSQQQQQDVLQQNVLFGGIYNTPTLQGTQQNTLLWPMVSRHSIQPATSLSYMSHPDSHQDQGQDILSSSATFASTPLFMTYDQTNSSVFSAQRMSSQLPQNPPVGLVLQQPQLRTASLLNVMQGSQSAKDSSVFSISPSHSPFQQVGDLHLMGMSQSDLTKHVNAKPFQPSSRTPPGGQPQQVMNHHSQFLGNQHAKFQNQVNKIGGQQLTLHQQQTSDQHGSSVHMADKRQLIQQHGNQQHTIQHLLPSHQQAIQPHSASQHSSISHHIRPLAMQQSSVQQTSPYMHGFPGGRIASVGPRSATGKTATASAPVQAQNRLGSMSPVDQGMHFIQGGISSVKGPTQPHQLLSNNSGSSLVQVHPYTQNLPIGQQQGHSFTVRPTSQMQKYTRVGPGPIQRPVKPTGQQNAVMPPANRPKQPVQPMVKTTEASSSSKKTTAPSFGDDERQKMIADTKRYFAAQQQKHEAPTMPTSTVAAVPFTRAEPLLNGNISSLQASVAKPSEIIRGKSSETKTGKQLEHKPVVVSESTTTTAEPKSIKSSEVKESSTSEIKQDDDKSQSEKSDLPDIAASAMLNDPSDIISIIKSRPSLAKAFNMDGVNKDKGTEKTRERKSSSKEEKPKRGGGVFKKGPSTRGGHRWSSTKADQRPSTSKPQTSRKTEGSSEKPKNSSSRGKS